MIALPVLDVFKRQVVRGEAGRRENYRGIVSRLTPSTDPLTVARAIRHAYDLNDFYLADLDGIVHQSPNFELYQQLIADEFRLLIDAGIRCSADAIQLVKVAENSEIVVGLETCCSPSELREISNNVSGVTFSLDLQDGRPRLPENAHGWNDDPIEIAIQALESNVKSILILDLSDVGMGTGVSTDSICSFVRNRFPEVRIIAGGGVRNRSDLNRLRDQGVNAVLVSSALHHGDLDRDDVHMV